MVLAWYMDNELTDQRLEHHLSPPKYVAIDELYNVTGVEYFKINVADRQTDPLLAELRHKRNYNYEDEITCSEACLPDYHNKLKTFFTEHLHTDEEIRLIIDGSGYFDVRDKNDQWIRISVVAGDLIVIPSGIYHRFTLDSKIFVQAKRYFIGEPVWKPYDRPCDDMDIRKMYLEKLATGFCS